jgi:hypothetical protein
VAFNPTKDDLKTTLQVLISKAVAIKIIEAAPPITTTMME